MMPSDPGAELAIHSHIGEIKKKDVPVIIDFELPSGEHKVVTFESYVTRADLKAALRHKRKHTSTQLKAALRQRVVLRSVALSAVRHVVLHCAVPAPLGIMHVLHYCPVLRKCPGFGSSGL